MATERDVNFRLAVQNAQQSVEALRTFGREGETALKRIVTATEGLDKAGQNISRFERQNRASWANAAQQIQDFVVQAQAGTNIGTILIQQGPQLASAFGAWGAAAGAATAVLGGAVLAMSTFSGEAPGYSVSTTTTGKLTSGNCSTGMRV